MKILKKWWFWLIIVFIAVFGVVVFKVFSGNNDPVFLTEQVKKGELLQTVDATGEVNSIDKVDLAFETVGTLDNLSIKVGDSVKNGDIIASLTAEDLKADVRRAEQSLAISSAKLQQQIAGATDERIAVVMADVQVATVNRDSAVDSLKNVKLMTEKQVSRDVISVSTKENDLENILANNEQVLLESRENLVNIMKSAMISVRSSISRADETLGIESPLVNDAFESVLKDQSDALWDQAVISFEKAVFSRDDAEKQIFLLTANNTDEEIENSLILTEKALQDTSYLLLQTRQILDKSTLDSASFPFATLLAMKTQLDTERVNLQTQESSFFNKQQMYRNSLINTKTSEDNARNALDTAKISLELSRASRNNQIDNAQAVLNLREADLNKANSALAEIESDPRVIDLAPFRADVARAQADLDSVRARLRKSQIISPITGIVTDIAFEVGEQVSGGMTAVTVQTTEDSQFKITANIPEADISKINVGNSVDMTFDAFGQDLIVKGSVGAIDPAEKIIEGVVYYNVDIFINEDLQDISLKPGMSVDVIILTKSKQNVIFVPQRSVLENENGKKYVRIPQGKTFEEREVRVGLRADGGLLEILEGVNEDDEVIISIKK